MTEQLPSRRKLLERGGVLPAGLAGGIGAGLGISELARNGQDGQTYIPEEFSAPKPRSAPGFDHLVVLMGENRSFDNLLGYLYTPDASRPGRRVPSHNTQLFGTQDEHNRGREVGEMRAPFNAPDQAIKATLGAFVLDYETDFARRTGSRTPPPSATRPWARSLPKCCQPFLPLPASSVSTITSFVRSRVKPFTIAASFAPQPRTASWRTSTVPAIRSGLMRLPHRPCSIVSKGWASAGAFTLMHCSSSHSQA